jgi:HK97 family phage prohead protease
MVRLFGYVSLYAELLRHPEAAHRMDTIEVLPGAWQHALAEAGPVACLIGHDWRRQIASTADGSLQLTADDRGLRAMVRTDAKHIIRRGPNAFCTAGTRGRIIGWSYKARQHFRIIKRNGLRHGQIDRIDQLREVSIVPSGLTPGSKQSWVIAL